MINVLQRILRIGITMSVMVLLAACGSAETESASPDSGSPVVQAIPVTTARAVQQDVVDQLHSVGRLVSRNAPTLAAEIDARVTDVLVDVGESVVPGQVVIKLDTTGFELARREARAEIQRLEASIANERNRVTRYRDLKKRDLMPVEKLDDAEAQLAVERASLEAASARLAIVENRLSKTEVRSPVEGVVEARHVSVGDYVKVGEDLLTVTDMRRLRALLPFPETVAHRLALEQTAMIESPLAPGQIAQARISQLKPEVGGLSRAVVAVVDLENPGGWRPDATAVANVIVARRPQAVVIPALAVVPRPAGQVVYLLDAGKARQQLVELGEWHDDWVEVTSGLNAGDTLVVEGAQYLTDGAAVTIREQGT